MKIAPLARALVFAFPCLAAAQVAVLHIKIIDGDEAVYAPGARSSRPLAVEVTDENGRPVPGAAVSFHLPDDGPGGVFGNGLRTELIISDANGRATVRNLQLNRTPGPFQVRITAASEQARAGTLARQSIAATDTAGRGTVPVMSKSHGSRKWVAVALVLAGVAGGVGAGVAGRSSPSHPAPPPSSVGAPTVTVGNP